MTLGARHHGAQPGRKLPVAANPPVQAARCGQVACWVVVEHLDVGDQSSARERSLNQIVAQQGVHGKASMGRALEHRDLVDPFPRKRALGEQILVHIRDSSRVRIDTRMTGEDCRVRRSVRARERHAHARLENAVALHHASGAFVEHGTVQRMRHCADERDGGVPWQHRIRVEGDHVAHAAQPRGLSLDGRERAVVRSEQVPVELHQLAALALPAHPDAVGGVQAPRAVKDVEGRAPLGRVRRVRRVEGTHPLHGRRHDGVIVRLHLGVCVEKIPEQREADFRITVCQVLCLEVIERLLHRPRAPEQNGHDNDSPVLRGKAATEGHARQPVGRQQKRHKLVDGRHRGVCSRRKRQQHGAQHADAGGSVNGLEQERECGRHSQPHCAEIEETGRILCRAIHTLTNARTVPECRFERTSPVVNEVVADMRGAGAPAGRSFSGGGSLNGGTGYLLLRDVRMSREVFDHVPVAIARLKRHAGIHPARVATQHGLCCTRRLHELGPVDAAHLAQTGDAVRHHELGDREMLRRTLHGLLDAHDLLADPLLEPQQRREIGTPAADLLEKTREERRGECRRVVDQVLQPSRERVATGVLRSEQARDPPVGLLRVVCIRRGAERHVPHVLQEPHAEHGRHCPQLADGERSNALILLHHQLEQCGVEAPVGVGDQLDGNLVDARIARERPWPGELRQLVVIIARERGANFLNLLEDDVEVVEQPFSSGADVESVGGNARQGGVDATKNPLGRGEALQQRTLSPQPSAARYGDDSLRPSKMSSMPREAICTEQLAHDDIAWGVRRPHVAETWRTPSPAAGKPHASFCSGGLSSSLPWPPIAEQQRDAEYARS